MKKKHLAARLDELERRVRELEARPLPMQQPIIVGPPIYAPYQPFQPTVAPVYPWWQQVTCSPGPSITVSLPPNTCGSGDTFITGNTVDAATAKAPFSYTDGGH